MSMLLRIWERSTSPFVRVGLAADAELKFQRDCTHLQILHHKELSVVAQHQLDALKLGIFLKHTPEQLLELHQSCLQLYKARVNVLHPAALPKPFHENLAQRMLTTDTETSPPVYTAEGQARHNAATAMLDLKPSTQGKQNPEYPGPSGPPPPYAKPTEQAPGSLAAATPSLTALITAPFRPAAPAEQDNNDDVGDSGFVGSPPGV
jgi:hypothetical protein